MKLNEIIKNTEGFMSLPSDSASELIDEYQKELHTKFSKEYIEYLKEFGVATLGIHEFTGISKSDRLNVVSVTKHLRDINKKIPDSLYVVEELGIENIHILQDGTGKVYEASYRFAPKAIASSIAEYLETI